MLYVSQIVLKQYRVGNFNQNPKSGIGYWIEGLSIDNENVLVFVLAVKSQCCGESTYIDE